MRYLAWLVAISPIMLLAACGGGASTTPGTTTTSLPPLPAAIGPATAQDLSAVRDAAAHTLTLRAAVSLQLLSPPGVAYPPVTGAGTFDFQTASGQELVHDSVGTETIVFQPTRIFDERPAAESAGLPHGRPWIRSDFSERLKKIPFLAQSLQRLAQYDPAFLLGAIAWGARDAAPLGPSTVDGVRADGYLVDVDAAHAMATASGPGARGFLRMAAFVKQELGAGLGLPPVVRVWVDSSNRVVSLRASTVGTGGGTTLITLNSFGTAVHPSPPDLSQTVDLAALFGPDTDHD